MIDLDNIKKEYGIQDNPSKIDFSGMINNKYTIASIVRNQEKIINILDQINDKIK